MTYTIQVLIDGDADDVVETDITEYVKSFDISIGIQDPMALVANVGNCSLLVDNSQRVFTPSNTASPLFGKIVPNTKVECFADTHRIFLGYVRKVVPQSGKYGTREAVLECEDRLSLLQSSSLTMPIQENIQSSELVKKVLARASNTAVAKGSIGYKLNDVTQVSENDTVTINGTTYRFKETPVQANDVLRAAPNDRVGQLDFLAAAINGGQGAGQKYFSGSTQPKDVVAVIQLNTMTQYLRSYNPLRYYRFDEGSGTNVLDRGENKRDGTYGGSPTLGVTQSPAYAEDPRTAATFDGVDDVASIPSLDLSNRSFAMHIMINPSAVSPPSQQSIISTWDGSDIFNVRLYSTGQLEVVNGAITATSATGVVSFGDWQRIVVSYDYYSKDMKVWVGATLVATANGTGLSATNTVFDVGRAVFLSEYFKGSLAEFALYLRSDFEGTAYGTFEAPSLILEANINGSWANGIAVSTTSAALTASNLTGGADAPLISVEEGLTTFDIAADRWLSDSTNALDAITQITESERGLFLQTQSGALKWENRQFLDTQKIIPMLPPPQQYVFSSDIHNDAEFTYGYEDVYNKVVVTFTPKTTLSSGVVAHSQQIISAAGRWGTENKPPSTSEGGRFSLTHGLPPYGTTFVKIPFVDRDRGKIVGAKDLILPPEPNVDFTAAEQRDGYGADTYTTYEGLKFSVAAAGSEIELSIENQALGTLYIIDFQLRGTAIVAYDPVNFESRDEESIAEYGTRTLAINLPIGGDQAYAQSLADYYLSIFSRPVSRVKSLVFNNTNRGRLSGVSIFEIPVGSAVITVSDTQLGITNQRYLISGANYSVSHKNAVVTFFLKALTDVFFWVLEDTNYGKLGETTRAGV